LHVGALALLRTTVVGGEVTWEATEADAHSAWDVVDATRLRFGAVVVCDAERVADAWQRVVAAAKCPRLTVVVTVLADWHGASSNAHAVARGRDGALVAFVATALWRSELAGFLAASTASSGNAPSSDTTPATVAATTLQAGAPCAALRPPSGSSSRVITGRRRGEIRPRVTVPAKTPDTAHTRLS
jgi:hypothetical protein